MNAQLTSPQETPAALPAAPAECAAWTGACSDPVFVLCAGRSGSTLLRFMLDAHPDLACPPETELPAVCTQLAAVWSMFSASLWPGPKAGASAAPEPVIAGLRHTMDLVVGPYLARRGKKRYCDKSLGSARHAGLLMRMYPEARFVCLYRHPMDLVASGLEACPWGLNSYGFEHYIGGSPGNAVAAIARYWADHTSAILAVQEEFPDRCHRVRYEDLVTSPGAVAAGIFEFAGVSAVPDISARFFSHERERFGRSDFKIWNTSRITTDSVGRGWSVPASMLPQPLLTTVNELAGRLGYRQIDQAWGTASRPADMLAPASSQPTALPQNPGPDGPSGPPVRLLAERLQSGVSLLDGSFERRWMPHSAERFGLVATSPRGQGDDACWLVDLAARTVTPGRAPDAAPAIWRATGTARAWEQVIKEGVNLGVVFRSGQMRYSDDGNAGPGSVAADTRVAMMAELLGITAWPGDEELAGARDAW